MMMMHPPIIRCSWRTLHASARCKLLPGLTQLKSESDVLLLSASELDRYHTLEAIETSCDAN